MRYDSISLKNLRILVFSLLLSIAAFLKTSYVHENYNSHPPTSSPETQEMIYREENSWRKRRIIITGSLLDKNGSLTERENDELNIFIYKEMKINKTYEISLKIEDSLVQNSTNKGLYNSDMPVSPVVKSSIDGDGFEITPLMKESEQPVGGRTPTQWIWHVKPRLTGKHKLNVFLLQRVEDDIRKETHWKNQRLTEIEFDVIEKFDVQVKRALTSPLMIFIYTLTIGFITLTIYRNQIKDVFQAIKRFIGRKISRTKYPNATEVKIIEHIDNYHASPPRDPPP
jgi:hypothetical protein